MKKVILLLVACTFILCGCIRVEVADPTEEAGVTVTSGEAITWTGEVTDGEHSMVFVEAKDVVIDEQTYIALFYDYTNGSNETAIPADWLDVKTFQNGAELTVIVFTGEEMEGAVQCDTSIQSGTTARIVWLFEKVDDSPVSVETSDGQEFVIE